MRRRRALAVVTLAAGALASCTAGSPPEVTNGDPVLVQGRAVYGSLCANCHAADGGGGRGQQLNDGNVLASFPDMADQIEVVTNGRDSMPAFSGRLTEAEIEAVVRYTREVLAVAGQDGAE